MLCLRLTQGGNLHFASWFYCFIYFTQIVQLHLTERHKKKTISRKRIEEEFIQRKILLKYYFSMRKYSFSSTFKLLIDCKTSAVIQGEKTNVKVATKIYDPALRWKMAAIRLSGRVLPKQMMYILSDDMFSKEPIL